MTNECENSKNTVINIHLNQILKEKSRYKSIYNYSYNPNKTFFLKPSTLRKGTLW